MQFCTDPFQQSKFAKIQISCQTLRKLLHC